MSIVDRMKVADTLKFSKIGMGTLESQGQVVADQFVWTNLKNYCEETGK